MSKIAFILKKNRRDKKTEIYKVIWKKGKKHLGIVKWSLAYNEYSYFPQNNYHNGLNIALMEPLCDFIKQLMNRKKWFE